MDEQEQSEGGGRVGSKSFLTVLGSIAATLVTLLAAGAFTFAWNTSNELSAMRATQRVDPIEFARLQAKVDQQTHEDDRQQEEIKQLREWLKAVSRRNGVSEPAPPDQ